MNEQTPVNSRRSIVSALAECFARRSNHPNQPHAAAAVAAAAAASLQRNQSGTTRRPDMNEKTPISSRRSIVSAVAEYNAQRMNHPNHPHAAVSGRSTKATLAVAAAAAASSQRNLFGAAMTAETLNRNVLTARLQSNDPTLTCLKLYKHPTKHFDDFGRFLLALQGNTVVSSVELTWKFLSALTDVRRTMLMTQLGLLPSIEAFELEGIGPSSALVVALRGARNTLKKLRIGFLRINDAADIVELANELGMQKALERVGLADIRHKVDGRYMLDAYGVVTFQETIEGGRQRLSIDPLLNALSSIHSLESIQLRLMLDVTKFSRIENQTIQNLCQNRKSLFLHSCDLDDEHCLAMAKQLQVVGRTASSSSPSPSPATITNSLETLVLVNNNRIGKRGWDSLVEMLQHNYHLQHLVTGQDQYDSHAPTPTTVRMGPIPSEECLIQMNYYLKLNRAGRAVLFGDQENSDMDSAKFLIQGKDDIDVVMFALRTNPSLYMSMTRGGRSSLIPK